MGVLQGNMSSLESFLQEQQKDLESAMSGLGDKLNSLAIVNAALDRRIGHADGFGEEYGVDSAFGGLRFVNEQAGDLITSLGGKDGLAVFEGTKYKEVVRDVGLLTADMVAAKAGLDAINANDIKQQLSELKATVHTSFTSLKTSFIQPLLTAHRKLMDPKGTILARVDVLESSHRSMAVDKDLFSGLMTGSFGPTGGEIGGPRDAGKVSSRIADLEAENTKFRTELAELRELCSSQHLEASRSSRSESDVTAVLGRLAILEAAEGEGVALGHEIFGSLQAVEHFLRTEVPQGIGATYAVDWVGLVHYANKEDAPATVDAIMARDHYANKGGFKHMMSAVMYASCQQSVPGALAGSRGASQYDFPLPGIKKFSVYDKQDGVHGVRNTLTRSVDMKTQGLLKMLNREMMGHPRALAVFTQLLLGAQHHWRTVGQHLTNNRNISFQQCKDEDEAWLYPCEVIRGVLDECHKVRNVGAERSSTQEYSLRDAARMMWGTLKTHQLMEDFVAHEFQGHPKLTRYALGHLFRHRCSPKALKDCEATIDGFKTKLTAGLKIIEAKK
jgi:hypothetical protein